MSSIFSKLFGNNKVQTKKPEKEIQITRTPECEQIQALSIELQRLQEKQHYVARSEYQAIVPKYRKAVEFFKVLEKSGMLPDFCVKNRLISSQVSKTISSFESLGNEVERINDEYISEKLVSEKEYLDNILKSVDPVIQLDEDQRKVVLTDEDYCLVIAGAGAGKTTTVAAKVKYLVERQNIDPKDILVISFTNKAVGELRDKINKDLQIDCPIATFHSTGNAILHINNPEQLNIVDGSKLYFLLQDYFRKSLLTNETLVNNLIMFFASYFDAPYEGDDLNQFFNTIAKANYTTLRSDLNEYKAEIMDARTKKNITIQNEYLRSYQEVEIANFLYLNGIDYEYEPVYPYNIPNSRKPYTPDFLIRQEGKVAYIEHFGITEEGKNNRYTEEELRRYKFIVNDKIMLHKEHGTELIYTFSEYTDKRSRLLHLEEKLKMAGFKMNPRSNQEILEKIISTEESKYVRRLVNLICRFIGNFKTNGYTKDEFSRMYHSTSNVRSRLFLNICEECYLEYERYLKENNAVDFEDMINESARVLREVKEMKQRLHFKYIIVDEYQDISKQRFDLTKALSEVTDAKIIAVGDDWQSIYAFSGSDITLFTNFAEKMGYAKQLKIVRTYRNSQEVIDIAGNFIQRNPSQIEKRLLSPKNIEDPVIIYTYDSTYKRPEDSWRTGAMYSTALAVEMALEQIMQYNRAAGKEDDGKILLLGRYSFDGDYLERSGLFENRKKENKLKSVKYPNLDITFMTVHMSKGLGYDNVIVVNGKNETYGFPAKIEDDPVLSFVVKEDHSLDYAEERRLFYVAMTRTKNRVFFIAPEQNPSEFLLEIKRDYKNVVLKGAWNDEEANYNLAKKTCPICGYPMQLRYKRAYGLRLYICTNEPEVCGFMTNDMRAGKLAITKCDKCVSGYLIAKSSAENGYFLGCTNYKANQQGCNNTISKSDYYLMMNLSQEPAPAVERMKPTSKRLVQKDVSYKSQVEVKMTDNAENQQDKGLSVREVSNSFNSEPVMNSGVFYKGYDLYQVAVCLLQCLEHISTKYFYGVTTLVTTVHGGHSEKLERGNLYAVPEYGRYPKISRDDLCAIVHWLIDNQFMLQTKQLYPKLHPTYEGMHYKETLTIDKLKWLNAYLENPRREIVAENKGGIRR